MARMCFHPRRTARRERAKIRQESHDKLSLDEKILKQGLCMGKEYQRLIALRDTPVSEAIPTEEIQAVKNLTAEQKAARKAEVKAAKKLIHQST